jgi:hypothetical protein
MALSTVGAGDRAITSFSSSSLISCSFIPEPETYAMLLAGLGMMGFVARRRKQKPLNQFQQHSHRPRFGGVFSGSQNRSLTTETVAALRA